MKKGSVLGVPMSVLFLYSLDKTKVYQNNYHVCVSAKRAQHYFSPEMASAWIIALSKPRSIMRGRRSAQREKSGFRLSSRESSRFWSSITFRIRIFFILKMKA